MTAMGIGLALPFVSLMGAGSYPFTNAEAAALVARFTTPPTNARKALIDAWWTTVKAAGVSASDLDIFVMHAGADSQASTRNWIADAYNPTPVNSPVFTADRGFTGNGTAYLDTGFNPTTASSPKYTLNSASMGLFVINNPVEVAAPRDIGNTNATIITRSDAGRVRTRANDMATIDSPDYTATTAVGMTSWSRGNSANYQIRKNGADLGPVTVNATVALANENMRILSGVTSAGNKQAAASWFGKDISLAKTAAIYAATLTYLQAVGAMP